MSKANVTKFRPQLTEEQVDKIVEFCNSQPSGLVLAESVRAAYGNNWSSYRELLGRLFAPRMMFGCYVEHGNTRNAITEKLEEGYIPYNFRREKNQWRIDFWANETELSRLNTLLVRSKISLYMKEHTDTVNGHPIDTWVRLRRYILANDRVETPNNPHFRPRWEAVAAAENQSLDDFVANAVEYYIRHNPALSHIADQAQLAALKERRNA